MIGLQISSAGDKNHHKMLNFDDELTISDYDFGWWQWNGNPDNDNPDNDNPDNDNPDNDNPDNDSG